MKAIVMRFLMLSISVFLLSACGNKNSKEPTIKVGTISGPETTLMEVAKKVAHDKYGLNIEIVEFTDYAIPNTALNDGSIDANVFQHLPYLEQTIKARNYELVPIGKTFIYPMGMYSKKITALSDLPEEASVAIPNDPTNEARALLLMEKAGLITLKNKDISGDTPITAADISSNPKKLKITPLKAAQLPRSLIDVDLAIINTNYAIPAGLVPDRDALFLESKDSLYANIIVVRTKTQSDPRFVKLIDALHSKEVSQEAEVLFSGQAIPAW